MLVCLKIILYRLSKFNDHQWKATTKLENSNKIRQQELPQRQPRSSAET